MKNLPTKDSREQLLELQLEKEKNLVKAQETVLNHLESAIKKAIEQGDSATVAAMAEILKN